MMENQKKLVAHFRQFMDKCIIPTIKNYGAVMGDWQGFNAILTQEPIDYSRLQAFLDSKNTSSAKLFPNYTVKRQDDKQKNNSVFRKKDDFPTPQSPLPDTGAYNRFNQTIGGDRARMNLFPLNKPGGGTGTTTITPVPQRKEDNNARFQSSSTTRILTNIEGLLKTLADNQQRFQHGQPNNHVQVPVGNYGGYPADKK